MVVAIFTVTGKNGLGWQGRPARRAAKLDPVKSMNLHRFDWAHKRVRDIAVRLVDGYPGDPRRIWDGQPSRETLARLTSVCRGEA